MKASGITEKIKYELDALSLKVFEAQDEVSQCQAAVNSLTEKVVSLQNRLTNAENARSRAKQNTDMVSSLVQQALELKENADIADRSMTTAGVKTAELRIQVKEATNKLIYAVEVANKLATIINRKKALNPLISDELIIAVTNMGGDANNAVALTLVALKAVFEAQAAVMASATATRPTTEQATDFYELLTGKGRSLNSMITEAYHHAQVVYDEAEKAVASGTRQLNEATAKFNRAQVKLHSLQAGLSAANAAALASQAG